VGTGTDGDTTETAAETLVGGAGTAAGASETETGGDTGSSNVPVTGLADGGVKAGRTSLLERMKPKPIATIATSDATATTLLETEARAIDRVGSTRPVAEEVGASVKRERNI
jgi:hypothetical protein